MESLGGNKNRRQMSKQMRGQSKEENMRRNSLHEGLLEDHMKAYDCRGLLKYIRTYTVLKWSLQIMRR